MATHKHNPYCNAWYTDNDLSSLVILLEQKQKIHLENIVKLIMNENCISAKAYLLIDEYLSIYDELLEIKDAQRLNGYFC